MMQDRLFLDTVSALKEHGVDIKDRGQYGAEDLQVVLSSLQRRLTEPDSQRLLEQLYLLSMQAQVDRTTSFLLKSIRVLPTGVPHVRFDNQRALTRMLNLWVKAISDDKSEPSEVQRASGVRIRTLQEIRRRGGRPRILFLGPNSFRQEVWDIRVKYLLPDLYAPLSEKFNLVMMVPEPPKHTIPGLLELAERFNIDVYSFHATAGAPRELTWLWAAHSLITGIRPSHVTNVQGHTFFGQLMTQLKTLHDIKAVLRVAGDELMARIGLGTMKGMPELAEGLLSEVQLLNRVDTVITMSVWEERRIKSMRLGKSQVVTCDRGVDTARFNPDVPPGEFAEIRNREQPTILYLGRRSAEKGYERVEEIARLAEATNIPMKFIFAGPGFEPGSDGNRTYLGFIDPDKLPNLLASVDGIILLSMTESLGQVVLEALGVGRMCFVGDTKYNEAFPDCPGIVVLPPSAKDALKAIADRFGGRPLDAGVSQTIRAFALKTLDSGRAQRRYVEVFSRG